MRRATRNATLDDVIIVDCSLDRAEDRARCAEVVHPAGLEVYIIYNPAARDHYDYWQDNLQYPGLGVVVNDMRMHYRLNSDCTLKAYWQQITAAGGASPQGHFIVG